MTPVQSDYAAVGDRRFTYGSVFQGAAGDRGGPAANAMTSLLDADLLTEAAADLLAVALQLNPTADQPELLNLTMASLGALSPQTPDAWLEMALQRVAEREGLISRPQQTGC